MKTKWQSMLDTVDNFDNDWSTSFTACAILDERVK